ncbi:MAG: hypothetical protein ACOY46_05920 [Bacillota bacterium]
MQTMLEDKVFDAFASEIYDIRKKLEEVDDPRAARKLFRRIKELKSLQFWHLSPSKREDILKL